jgi:hypothetical protein
VHGLGHSAFESVAIPRESLDIGVQKHLIFTVSEDKSFQISTPYRLLSIT